MRRAFVAAVAPALLEADEVPPPVAVRVAVHPGRDDQVDGVVAEVLQELAMRAGAGGVDRACAAKEDQSKQLEIRENESTEQVLFVGWNERTICIEATEQAALELGIWLS